MNRVLLLWLFFFSSLLYGANILSYNIYDRTDRVDIMFTFDVPYHGKIVQSRYASKIVLKLYDAKIESTKVKRLSSPFLTALTISPMDGYTQIVANVPSSNIILKASKTADAYGLRLRFMKKSALESASLLKQQALGSQNRQNSNKLFSNLPTKKENDISTSYYIVVGLLLLGVIVMLLLKRKLVQKQSNPNNKPSSGWLFKNATPTAPPMKQQSSSDMSSSNQAVSIRFQRQLDENNSVVMLDFGPHSYLLLLGAHNNILLEKFYDEKPLTEEEFDLILKEKHTQLNEYMQMEKLPPKEEEEITDTLKSFSKKASNIPYNL